MDRGRFPCMWVVPISIANRFENDCSPIRISLREATNNGPHGILLCRRHDMADDIWTAMKYEGQSWDGWTEAMEGTNNDNVISIFSVPQSKRILDGRTVIKSAFIRSGGWGS